MMLPRSSVTKFHHFGQYLKIFVKIFKVYLVLGKGLSSLLGKFSLLKLANIENTIWSSGHTAEEN